MFPAATMTLNKFVPWQVTMMMEGWHKPRKAAKRVKEKKGKGNKSVMWWARFSSAQTVLSIAPGRPAAWLWLTASRWQLNRDVSSAADHTHVDANDERARWCGYPRWSLVLWVKDACWGASTRASVYPAAPWGFGLTMPFRYEANEERKKGRAGAHGELFGSWERRQLLRWSCYATQNQTVLSEWAGGSGEYWEWRSASCHIGRKMSITT